MDKINLRIVGLALMAAENQALIDGESPRRDLMSVNPKRLNDLLLEKDIIDFVAKRIGIEAVNLNNEAINYMRTLRMKR